jgi:hypothetical protein
MNEREKEKYLDLEKKRLDTHKMLISDLEEFHKQTGGDAVDYIFKKLAQLQVAILEVSEAGKGTLLIAKELKNGRS